MVSPQLLEELKRVLAYPKLRRHIPADEAERVIEWLGRVATVAPDPKSPPPVRSIDPADDYLVALAATERALLVSGDDHLLVLRDRPPVHTPASFLALLDAD